MLRILLVVAFLTSICQLASATALLPYCPTAPADTAPADTASADTASAVVKSDIDTIITISARDSAHYSVGKKVMRLRGKADVNFKQQRIEAEIIEMNFGTSVMNAEGATDSSGRVIGFPVFTDKGEQFAGESMLYNFHTGRGRVKFGETSVEGGFYYGSRIKRVGEKTAYVEDGCFTTCDAAHPHFYFQAPQMKVVMEDKVYLDQATWYVEDIPVMWLPFGLFFDARKGRRSGFIMPSPLFTNDRGIVLQGLGYYFAVSDYFDTQLTADITTKGGFTAYNESQYVVRDQLNGRTKLTFGYSRFNVEDPYQMNFALEANHQQLLRPNEQISADVFFSTSKLYQNTSINPIDRVRQNARSNASYQRTFYNGMTFNVGGTRDQNLINSSVSNVASASFGIPQLYPLRSAVAGDNWLRDLTLQYRSTARYTYNSQRTTDTGAFNISENTVIEHRPAVTVTPKLGNFTVQPTVSYSENWYFQRYSKEVDATDSSEVSTREGGFFREYTYGAGISASSFLYGMMYPKILGVAAFRHTLQPTIGLQYRPDQSDPALGFFGQYTGRNGKTQTYSRFGSGIASQTETFKATLNLFNKFSIKPMQADSDTVAAKPIDLLTVNLATAYDMIADSINLDPITFGIRTPVLEAITFQFNGSFTPYDQALVEDATGRQSWQTLGSTMMENGKGLGRFTNLTVQLGTSFSSQGVSFEQRSIVTDTANADTTKEDLRSRFGRRLNSREEEVDLFADHTPGWSPVIMPWEMRLDLSYNYSNPNPDTRIQTLLMTFNASLRATETLSINAIGTVNLIKFELNTPVIDITKRIHCWNLSLKWVPLGINQGFYLRFSAAAPQLRGLEFPKQSTPLYR